MCCTSQRAASPSPERDDASPGAVSSLSPAARPRRRDVCAPLLSPLGIARAHGRHRAPSISYNTVIERRCKCLPDDFYH